MGLKLINMVESEQGEHFKEGRGIQIGYSKQYGAMKHSCTQVWQNKSGNSTWDSTGRTERGKEKKHGGQLKNCMAVHGCECENMDCDLGK